VTGIIGRSENNSAAVIISSITRATEPDSVNLYLCGKNQMVSYKRQKQRCISVKTVNREG
jgi:hypothetical protein